MFTSEGAIEQVERAREAVKRGPPALGMRSWKFIILASEQGRIMPVGERVSVAVGGSEPDGRRLVDQLRDRWADQLRRLGEEPYARDVALWAGDMMNRATLTERLRPYATALIVADDAGGLYLVDPSGVVAGGDFQVVGRGSEAARAPEGLEGLDSVKIEQAARQIMMKMGFAIVQVVIMRIK